MLIKDGILNRFKLLSDAILDTIFPSFCLVCETFIKRSGILICDTCRNKITIDDSLFCTQCRARLPDNKKTCHKNAAIFGAAARYSDEKIQKLIWDLKYGKKLAAAKALSDILLEYVQKLDIDLAGFHILPVPLHPLKEKTRGFNQVEIIAEQLAKKIGLQIIKNGLIKIKNNKAQAEINEIEKRIENVQGAYLIKNPLKIKDRNILILDDVFTTGATMNEISVELKKTGAKKIIGLVVAKA